MNNKRNFKETSQPIVTVAMFAWNQEKYVRLALESVLEQDYLPLEIIVSDDCSNDSTYGIIQEVISAYQGPHTVRVNRMPKHAGLARHMNHVFNMAEGDTIVVAAGDDICFKNKVSALVRPMLDDENVMGVHSDIIEINMMGKVLRRRVPFCIDDQATVYQIIQGRLSLMAQSHAFRKEVHEYFGPYNDDLSNEGLVMAFRERSMGRIVYLPEPLTYYRIGSGVSTYQGMDVDQLTWGEPRKIAGWHYTAFKQVESDSRRLANVSPQLSRLIVKLRCSFESVYRVINSPWEIGVLLRALGQPDTFIPVFKAFLRTNAPRFLRAAYCGYAARQRSKSSY